MDRVDQLEGEIAKLKRFYQRLSMALTSGVILLLSLMLMGMQPRAFGEIRAEEFILQDEMGRICGLWAATDQGTYLTMFDRRNTPRIRLMLNNKDQQRIEFLDGNEEIQCTMMCNEVGPHVIMFDQNHKLRLALGDDGKSVGAHLFDSNQVQRIEIATEDNSARLRLSDQESRERLQLYTLSEHFGFAMKDTEGKNRLLISEVPDSGPLIIVRDKDNKTLYTAP